MNRYSSFGPNETYETTVDHLMVYMRVLFGMEDFHECVIAFVEKRTPSFTGRQRFTR